MKSILIKSAVIILALTAIMIFSWKVHFSDNPETDAVALQPLPQNPPTPQNLSIHVPIDIIADHINAYLLNQSKYPDSLNIMFRRYDITPRYTYLASDLKPVCPDELIILYETDPDANGWRNVLFHGKVKQYHIRGEIVSRAEYEKEYNQLMKHRDPEETMLTDDAVLQIDWNTGMWYTRCDFELKKIVKLNENDFQQALTINSQLRKTANSSPKTLK